MTIMTLRYLLGVRTLLCCFWIRTGIVVPRYTEILVGVESTFAFKEKESEAKKKKTKDQNRRMTRKGRRKRKKKFFI